MHLSGDIHEGTEPFEKTKIVYNFFSFATRLYTVHSETMTPKRVVMFFLIDDLSKSA
jgi:hypothetical protein